MNGSTAGTLQEVVNARNYEQLVTMFLQVNKTFVGVYHLLKVNLPINHMHK